MKRLSILGSTGSIGTSTLDVVEAFPELFVVEALAAGGNIDRLAAQIERHRPRFVCVKDDEIAAALRARVGAGPEIAVGPSGLVQAATLDGVDLVVSALVGARGLPPTHAALELGRDVALANKEALVVAGRHMTDCARSAGAEILPVDSEHNALHQCLRGERIEEVRNLWLTASGGPFRGRSAEELVRVDAQQALQHPTWSMGAKITIDSATLMNKGLEVIEAHWLFALPPERIRVVVHPQSIVHSMIELIDGSFKAQLGVTDMRHPIQYALSWPERLSTAMPPFDPVAVGRLDFEAPDVALFPCLRLAYEALEAGGAAPAALNAANEVAVESFLAAGIGFLDIPAAIEAVLERHAGDRAESLEAVLEVDAAARRTAAHWLEQRVGG
ncbi:MAG: 1-deoxy-D-xylulose-5-phosphate reductoisomerase [bacterium]|nr:1-deoxy-D-xylulose-5-phosphate reductoisomerase [bacterium]